MGGKSGVKKLPFERTTEYGRFSPGGPDIQPLRDFKPLPETLAPARQAKYDRAQQLLSSSYGSAYNQNLPAMARLAGMERGRRNLLADQSAEEREAAFRSREIELGKLSTLAGLTLERFLPTKESGFNSGIQESDRTSQIISGIFSDKRGKENIRPVGNVLERLPDVQARTWDWKDGGQATGVVAQELEQSFPEAVIEGDNGNQMAQPWGIDPVALTAINLQATKELNDKVNMLTRRNQLAKRGRSEMYG